MKLQTKNEEKTQEEINQITVIDFETVKATRDERCKRS